MMRADIYQGICMLCRAVWPTIHDVDQCSGSQTFGFPKLNKMSKIPYMGYNSLRHGKTTQAVPHWENQPGQIDIPHISHKRRKQRLWKIFSSEGNFLTVNAKSTHKRSSSTPV